MAYTENEIMNLVSGSEVTGQSTYDLWKSLGNEGGPQDFLDYLKDDGDANVDEETLAQIEQNKNDISRLSEEIVNQQTEIDNKQPKGNYLTSIPSEYITNNELTQEFNKLTLGLHTDGLVYLFKNGEIMGSGVAMIGGETGDVIGNVDSSNTIILNGNLALGDYTIKYEMEDGSLVDIGTLTLADEPTKPTYTNLADPNSSDWLANSRLGSSGVSEETNGSIVTNYIPCKKDDMIRVDGLNIGILASLSNARVHLLDSNKNILGAIYPLENEGAFVFDDTNDHQAYEWSYKVGTSGNGTTYFDYASNIAFIRFCGRLENAASDVIITKNEEIA